MSYEALGMIETRGLVGAIEAADAMAKALAGEGVKMAGEANEGKINLVAEHDGILKVNS